MLKRTIVSLVTTIFLGVLAIGCGDAPTSNDNAAVTPDANRSPDPEQLSKDSAEELGLLITLPYEPAEVAWRDTPGGPAANAAPGNTISLAFDTPLDEAVKLGLLSFDSTMKSNLGVARPIDLVILPAEPALPPILRRIDRDDPYFDEITKRWARMLREAVHAIPNPDWLIRD